ncbi:hypothetical protein CYY_008664 [Polysphondylium violaceum]|uniref:F5/8 type C domain-containing protein n=1 Tax=Polysphondylium violaceum TaxID=133409 RepID=A0A8J4UWR9_9MYCE|nr:hypothetical protein CYY_008664 [Polysphondylium violaceum]
MSVAGLVPVLANAMCNLRTSTNYNGVHTQFNSVLNFKNNGQNNIAGSEAWCASNIDTNQFLVAGGEVPKTFMAVAIQGRGDADQWVTSYKIRYSLDNVSWSEYRNGAAINACSDRNTVQTHFFDAPIRARSIAIHPLSWHGHISMRCELYIKPLVEPFVQVGDGIYTGDNCALNTGSGKREVTVKVQFPLEFAKVPKVSLTFDQIDCCDSTNQTRIGVRADNITNKGFDCVFYTWNENKVYSLRADYVAVSNE